MTTSTLHISTPPVNDDQQLAKVANRILSRVERTDDGCLIWQGRIQPDTGYGRIRNGENDYTHRVIAARFIGDPTGKHVHHACHQRACCNPSHLQLMTPSEHGRLTALERKGARS